MRAGLARQLRRRAAVDHTEPARVRAADRSSAWLRSRPTLLARWERSGDPLAGGEALELNAAKWQGHAVIVGHMRVGSPIDG
jgi:hypothetical protein